MTVSGGRDPEDEAVRLEAADWIARLHAPDGATDREAFEAWRGADPAHAVAYERMEQRWEQSKFLANTELGRSRRLHRARNGWLHPLRSHAIAASIAALLLVGLGAFGLRETGYFQPPGGAEAAITYASRDGELRTIRLSDGSRVILDAGTALRVAFTSAERRLRLDRGRARFDVAHDSDRPFVVDANGGSVIAHGTMFDVSVTDTGVKVVLLTGDIEVLKRGGASRPSNSSRRHLKPGQQVSFGDARAISTPAPARRADMIWASGMLSFDATRLDEAIASINRRSARKISLTDAKLGDLRITGAFRGDDPLGFAEAVAATFDLTVTDASDAGMLLEPRQKVPAR